MQGNFIAVPFAVGVRIGIFRICAVYAPLIVIGDPIAVCIQIGARANARHYCLLQFSACGSDLSHNCLCLSRAHVKYLREHFHTQLIVFWVSTERPRLPWRLDKSYLLRLNGARDDCIIHWVEQ